MTQAVASLVRPRWAIPNYRRFFAGQIVSVSGNWMQNVAAMWLVLHLTGSGTAVGLTAAAQFLPLLLFGAWGGLLADRIPKRTLLMITQILMAIPPLALFAMVATDSAQAWMVIARRLRSAASSPRSTTRPASRSSSRSSAPTASSTRSASTA